MRMEKFDSVDDYLDAIQPEEFRAYLTHLSAVLKGALPDAEEVISYGMPMYKQAGMVIGFAAFKKHCSLFPGHTVADFVEELKDFKTSKGTIQFLPSKPLPDELIVRIALRRLQENLEDRELKMLQESKLTKKV